MLTHGDWGALLFLADFRDGLHLVCKLSWTFTDYLLYWGVVGVMTTATVFWIEAGRLSFTASYDTLRTMTEWV